ncbi:MAG: hypothetical protein QXF52_02870 [Thermoproteota archaeon]
MGRSLRIALIVVESVATFLILIPTLLWLLLNFYHLKYKIGRNRKKMVKALKKEGLSESVSVKIAEHVFPKIEFSLWTLPSILHAGEYREEKRLEADGKQNR